jgi:hypothetical protein
VAWAGCTRNPTFFGATTLCFRAASLKARPHFVRGDSDGKDRIASAIVRLELANRYLRRTRVCFAKTQNGPRKRAIRTK